MDLKLSSAAAADDNFTISHLQNGEKKMICRTLKHHESALEALGFLRVHKSHLINLDHVKRYRKGKGGTLVMADDQEIRVSNTKKQALIAAFR